VTAYTGLRTGSQRRPLERRDVLDSWAHGGRSGGLMQTEYKKDKDYCSGRPTVGSIRDHTTVYM